MTVVSASSDTNSAIELHQSLSLKQFLIPSIVSGKEPFDISKFLEDFPVNFPSIFRIYYFRENPGNIANAKRKRKLYQRLYRKVRSLEHQGLLRIKKKDSILGITKGPRYYSCIEEIMQGSKEAESIVETGPVKKDIYKSPRRRLIQQQQAIDICLNRRILDLADREAIYIIFKKYLKRYETKTIGYEHNGDNEQQAVHVGPCRIRFTDKGRHVREIIHYNGCWEKASHLYNTGVVVGLTTAPYKFENIYHANCHFGSELNRFFTNISYKQPKRRPYIFSYEFTKTGILHAHIAFFGVTHLHSSDESEEIAWIQKRWSQGNRVSSEEIRKDPLLGIWHRVKTDSRVNPNDSLVENTREYLGKCLTKKFDSELYWTFGQVYHSYSKELRN